MSENGQSNRKHLGVTMTPNPLDPKKMDINVSMPKNVAEAYVLLKVLMDAVFQTAMQRGEQRMVKTPDELGVKPHLRLQ